MNWRALYDKLFGKDLGTWIGHGVLGFLIDLAFGPAAVFVAFVYREASDMLEWQFSDDPSKRPLRDKLRDGFFDLWAPIVGAGLAELLKALL